MASRCVTNIVGGGQIVMYGILIEQRYLEYAAQQWLVVSYWLLRTNDRKKKAGDLLKSDLGFMAASALPPCYKKVKPVGLSIRP